MNYSTILLLMVNLWFNNVETIIVKTEQGQLRGEYLQTVTGEGKYVSFKGIPYAKPPVGDIRFMAPLPPACWSGVRNATQHGPVCIQKSIFVPNKNVILGSEDCLYLNVYTPNVKPKERLSVMFFIHGGGFRLGSGNVERHGPDYLITEDVIVVTINYRLGPFGFLNLNTREIPGNAGMKDQVAALRWVHKNIANFGGDPNKITIFGQSAGGVSVSLHNMSPMTKNLYKRSVAISGSPFNDWAVPFKPRRLAFKLEQELGMWTRNDRKLLTFLKSLPAEQFIDVNPALLRSQDPNFDLRRSIFGPTVEIDYDSDHFLTIDPAQALKEAKINDVDLMIGHTTMEGLINFEFIGDTIPELYRNYTEMIIPRSILENIPPANIFGLADKIHMKYFGNKPISDSVAKEFVRYLSDYAFAYGILKYARMFSVYRNTFVYKFTKVTNFTRQFNLDNKYGINAATHSDDLLYLFYPHDGSVVLNKNSDDYKVIKYMCALYTNFAKYGNPTPSNSLGVTWPKYNSATGYYLNIDSKLTVGKKLEEEMVSFWDYIYEAVGLD